MFKKLLILSLAIVMFTAVKAHAQYLCGSTGFIYRNQNFCNANCSTSGTATPCEELSPSTSSAPACPSGYEGFVFDPTNNMTYALNTTSQFWTYFQGLDTSSQELATIPNSNINSVLDSILTFYNIPNAWIGLYDPTMSTDYNTVNPNRPYSWADGSTPSYFNWASGQPNNALPSQDLSLLPSSEYGQHWIEMENNGTWNDIGYDSANSASQNYAPYLPALFQFNNQLSCVSGVQPPTPLTTTQEGNLANEYCGGNTTNCYLCTNGTDLSACVSGSTFPSGTGELCPYSQTACNENTSTPSCPSGYTWNGSTCTEQVTTTTSPSSCPSGYSWNGSACVTQVSIMINPSCPSGYTWTGSTCRSNTENQASCPATSDYCSKYTLSKGPCECSYWGR